MLIGEHIHDPDVARTRAANGAAYLDGKFGPGWQRLIDLQRLDVGTCGCVLGQLGRQGMICLPSPRRAVECGFSCGLWMDVLVLLSHAPFLGRLLPLSKVVHSYALLTQAWREVLERRRQPAPVANAAPVPKMAVTARRRRISVRRRFRPRRIVHRLSRRGLATL